MKPIPAEKAAARPASRVAIAPPPQAGSSEATVIEAHPLPPEPHESRLPADLSRRVTRPDAQATALAARDTLNTDNELTVPGPTAVSQAALDRASAGAGPPALLPEKRSPPPPQVSLPAKQAPVRPAGEKEIHAHCAEPWRLVLGWLIDLAVLAVLMGGGAALLLAFGDGSSGLRGGSSVAIDAGRKLLLPIFAMALLVVVGYSAAFATWWQGRTVGRRLTGVRLVDDRGLPPGPARSLVRAALSILSFALLLGGFWLSIFDRRRQTLHDRLTSTFVVRPSQR